MHHLPEVHRFCSSKTFLSTFLILLFERACCSYMPPQSAFYDKAVKRPELFGHLSERPHAELSSFYRFTGQLNGPLPIFCISSDIAMYMKKSQLPAMLSVGNEHFFSRHVGLVCERSERFEVLKKWNGVLPEVFFFNVYI